MAADEHRCEYREQAEQYRARVESLEAQVAELKRVVFGQRSERMPSVARELKRQESADDKAARQARAQQKRLENRELKDELVEEVAVYEVKEDERNCPKCGGTKFSPLGAGKKTTVYDYVPGHFIKRVIVQQTLACRCGECVLTAKAPAKVIEQGKYGPGLMAHIALRKCGDQMPIYRLEKDFKRLGVPVARSTMTDLFHHAASVLSPLSRRLLELVASSDVVTADETPVRVQATKKCKRSYVWTFTARQEQESEASLLVTYRYSKDRSGRTPAEVLGGSTGTLVVDGYTGYNGVTDPDGWKRAACLAHVRRKFFEAVASASVAKEALDLILDVYRVEHEALALGISGTAEHATLRQTKSRAAMNQLHAWLLQQEGLHPPRGKLGNAIDHALKNWDRLTVFLDDVRVPPDNNVSERQLRSVAVGRKNWLFLGSDEAGKNFCGLQSLVASCEANGVNPWEYLRDVLARIGDHPAKDLDELLPHRWQEQVAA